MKQYYIKYLLAGGRPTKDKDKYVSFLDEYKTVSEFDGNYDYGRFSPANKDMGCRKVKLFLCSRDIRNGDTLENRYGNYTEVSDLSGEQLEGLGVILESLGLHKSIAEVYENATDIVEGMEFDKDDLDNMPRFCQGGTW